MGRRRPAGLELGARNGVRVGDWSELAGSFVLVAVGAAIASGLFSSTVGEVPGAFLELGDLDQREAASQAPHQLAAEEVHDESA